jgi:hypothetical protein
VPDSQGAAPAPRVRPMFSKRALRGVPAIAVVGTVLLLLGSGLPVAGSSLASTTGRSATASAAGTAGAPTPPGPFGSSAPGCDGPWPAFAGETPYALGCPGRDQAIAGFYSPLAGGAGNVSVQLTLPSDRGPTQNQSDLYRALWLGLVLADPHAWLGECLVEIRFQPDATWNTTTGVLDSAPNLWAGSLVGWQFDPATGAEDTCVEEPMTATSGASGYLLLTGGDVLNITTVGWVGAANGESITVADTTSGATSVLRGLVADGSPLDPAYSSSTVTDAFSGSAAQLPPVSFGVELAGGANPSVVSNATFGGCTPGVPPATAADPSIPCPSYNPLSWINDTASPLQLTPPVFSSASGTARAGELLFSSGIGGGDGVNALSNQSCAGRLGSAYCTYPWYSYSCGAGALEFGATDYSGITSDFGQSGEFGFETAPNLVGYPQFTANAFSIPGCGGAAENVTVGVSAGLGRVSLNDANFTAPSSVVLAPGAYLLTAVPTPGSSFAGWTTTGSASVADPSMAATSLSPNHGGTVTATFTTAPTLTQVMFVASGANGSFELGPAGGSTVNATTPVASGATVSLAAGAYPLQVAPSAGAVAANWTATSGVTLDQPFAAATWLLVPSDGGSATVTAELASTMATTTLVVRTVGNGTVSINGTAIPYNASNETSFGAVSLRAGAVDLTADATPGWTFLGWTVLPGAVAVFGGQNDTNVTLAPGEGYAVGQFAANVTVLTSPGPGGEVSFDGALPVANGTVVPLTIGVHDLGAAPWGGFEFTHWRVSAGGGLTVSRPTLPLTKITVNSTGTLTALFVNATNETLTLNVTPAGAGTVEFNFRTLASYPTVNASVVSTTYEIKPLASYGSKFLNWSVTGPATVSAGELLVTGGGAVVTARFGPKFFPVTFIDTRPGAATLSLNGAVEPSGTTALLPRGVYNLSATVLLQNVSFLSWSSALAITNVSANHLKASVTVDGPGTVYGIVAGFVLNGLAISPSTVDVGAAAHLSVFVNGSGPLTYKYLGLPPGCASVNRPAATCRPTQPGTFPVKASVTDSGGDVATTASVLLTVVGDPYVASFLSTPATTDVGLPVDLTVDVSLGLGPYTYLYSDLPTGCTSANLTSLACTPTGAGTFPVQVAVNDSDGVVATAHVTVTVNADPSVTSLTANHSVLDVGMALGVTTVATGGTGGLEYAYTGLPTGCPVSTAATVDCVPTANGTWTVGVTVTDALGKTATSFTVVTTNVRPSVTGLSFAPSSIPLGQATQLTTSASGGTGGLSYDYVGLPSGCSSTNVSTFSCTPIASGTFTVTVVVTDALGVNATHHATLTVASLGSTSTPPPTPTPGIDWWIVALFAVVALVVAAVLVWRFGRPPETESAPER